MILGGYLILPSSFDTDPELRFSKAALVVIVVALLVVGYITTAVLFFVVPSWLFRSENILYPALCSSALGLLGNLYAFASSPRYEFTGAAGAAVALTCTSTAIYAVLLVWIQRRIGRVREGVAYHQSRISVTDIPPDGRDSQASTVHLFQPANDPSYYRNYLANMHPTAVRNPSLNARASFQSLHQTRSPSPPLHPQQQYYDPTSTTVSATPTHLPPESQTHYPSSIHTTGSIHSVPPPTTSPLPIGEDELVSQQMARLLLNTRDPRPSPDSGSTFRIDWRTDDEDSPTADTAIQLRARSGSGSRLVPPGRLASAVQIGPPPAPGHAKKDSGGRSAALLARMSPFRGGDRTRKNAADAEVERGRSAAITAGEQPRAKSRDERRREIELGMIGASMEGRPLPSSNGNMARFQ